MTDLIGTKELATLIQEMADSRRNGTVFIRTHDGHASMLVFDAGKLIGINYGGHRGANAIPLIMEFSEGTCSVSDTPVGQPQPGLPTAQELASLLLGSTTSQVPPAVTQVKPTSPADAPIPAHPKPAPVAAAKPSAAGGFPVTRAFSRIGTAMIDYLGPIGPTLCRKKAGALGETATYDTAWGAVQELAADIFDQGERARFLALAEEILKEHSRG